MEINKIKQILGVLVILIVILGAGYYVYIDIITISNTNEEPNIKTKIDLSEGISIEGEGNYTVEIVPVDDAPSILVPDLDREIVFSTDFSTEAQNILRSNIQKISEELKKDNSFFDNWLELGIQRKTIGDYEGAREAWDYAVAIRPLGSVSYHNLGDLYAYYLKDTQKAEENFLKAIENGPNDIYLYFKISEFYVDVVGDTGKARAIVEQGIKENPNSSELQNLLNSLQIPL